MIERAIENWLTNTNEKNYQTPFCQVLMSKGHKIIYRSGHGLMEQGKDIISVDGKGEYNAYQLKTGDIDLRKWREIRGEVRELIELPIVHPSVDKAKGHKSFLVLNGDITDVVRIQIDLINNDNKQKARNYSHLNVINGKMLLRDFVDAQGNFMPRELSDFELFLRLFLADGTDFLRRDIFFDFLNRIFFEADKKKRSEAVNSIAGSIVITGYSLNPFQVKKNHYSLFEAWICLAASIKKYAKEQELRKLSWTYSFELAFSEAIRNLLLLKEETLGREDFLEGDPMGDGGKLYQARVTIVLGTLSCLETHSLLTEEGYNRDEKLLELVKKNIDLLLYWGESCFPYYFGIIKYLEIVGETLLAYSLLEGILKRIIEGNNHRKQTGFANPYYGFNEIHEALFMQNGNKIDFTQFPGSSYILKSVIMMMVRRDLRAVLERNWKEISYFHHKEFILNIDSDTFTWRTRNGTNHLEPLKQTQSWAKLKSESDKLGSEPDFLVENLGLLRFFVLVCPHRANNTVISLLDRDYRKAT